MVLLICLGEDHHRMESQTVLVLRGDGRRANRMALEEEVHRMESRRDLPDLPEEGQEDQEALEEVYRMDGYMDLLLRMEKARLRNEDGRSRMESVMEEEAVGKEKAGKACRTAVRARSTKPWLERT